MYLIMTKQRKDMKIRETAILPAHIKGMEPCTIAHNGKKFPGAKIYTPNGFFKAFVNPEQVAMASALAAQTGEVIKLTPAVASIQAATQSLPKLPVTVSKAAVIALPLPQSLPSKF
jgi:hypothetical protein